jgi:hypothetical protein
LAGKNRHAHSLKRRDHGRSGNQGFTPGPDSRDLPNVGVVSPIGHGYFLHNGERVAFASARRVYDLGDSFNNQSFDGPWALGDLFVVMT